MRLFLTALSMGAALAASLSMPGWLAPYPGATPRTQESAGLLESSYSAAASSAEVAAHYEKELSTAGVKSSVNDDGLGIALRASAPECDLLIRIRERDGASFVSVSCAEKSSGSASGTYMPNGTAMTNRSAPAPGNFRERNAQRDQHMAGMRNFDQPVPPQPQTPLVLKWPSWLVHMPSADHGLQVDRKKYEGGLEYLESSYTTSAPMTSIYNFYDDLLKANGYRVNGHVRTGSTSTHVQQNAEGSVEGRLTPNGIGNGTMQIRVDFSRMFLNQPITVRLNVTAYPPGHY